MERTSHSKLLAGLNFQVGTRLILLILFLPPVSDAQKKLFKVFVYILCPARPGWTIKAEITAKTFHHKIWDKTSHDSTASWGIKILWVLDKLKFICELGDSLLGRNEIWDIMFPLGAPLDRRLICIIWIDNKIIEWSRQPPNSSSKTSYALLESVMWVFLRSPCSLVTLGKYFWLFCAWSPGTSVTLEESIKLDHRIFN